MNSANTTRRGRAMSARSSSAAMSVYDGRCCIGFIIAHGRISYESFDVDRHSIGLFSNERDAAAALWRIARGQVEKAHERAGICPSQHRCVPNRGRQRSAW